MSRCFVHRKQQEGVQPSFSDQLWSPTEVAGLRSPAHTISAVKDNCSAPTLVHCSRQMLLSVLLHGWFVLKRKAILSCSQNDHYRIRLIFLLSFSCVMQGEIWCYLFQLLFCYWCFLWSLQQVASHNKNLCASETLTCLSWRYLPYHGVQPS